MTLTLINLQVWALMLLQEAGGVGFDPMSMWNQMTWLGKAVVIVMFIMSAWSIGVMIDRLIAFKAAPVSLARLLRPSPARSGKASSTKQLKLPIAIRRAISRRSLLPACRNFGRTRKVIFRVKRSKRPSARSIVLKPSFTPS